MAFSISHPILARSEVAVYQPESSYGVKISVSFISMPFRYDQAKTNFMIHDL